MTKQSVDVEAVLAVGSLILFAVVTGAILWHKVPAENEKYAMLMLGALIGVVKDTFGRYFQATKGAQEQRQAFAELATAAVAAAPTSPAPGTANVQAAADVDVTVRDATAPVTAQPAPAAPTT